MWLNGAWQWFSDNAAMVFTVAAFIFALFFWLDHQMRRLLEREATREQVFTPRRVIRTFFGLAQLLSVAAVFLALVAIILRQQEAQFVLTTELIQKWFIEHGIPIVAIILIAYIIYRFLIFAIPRAIERSSTARGKGRRAEEELKKRSHTVSAIITQTIGAFIAILAVFMILLQLGQNITPLLASAGIAGIAIGFGAQSIVRDILNGLFILTEDQYNNGDTVRIAGVSGVVENVNLRRTILRDLDGTVHTVPNGEVRIASNYTKEWSRVNLDIPVGYGQSLDRVIEVVNRVAKELSEDSRYAPMITTPPRVHRVENFGDTSIELKVLGDTRPAQQWEIMSELRIRIKQAFDREGIKFGKGDF